jgi:hypothetical protein
MATAASSQRFRPPVPTHRTRGLTIYLTFPITFITCDAMLPWLRLRPCRGCPSTLVSWVWVAAWAWQWHCHPVPPVTLATAAAGRQGGGGLCHPTRRGGVSIALPFGLVPDHATEASCGVIGFQVLCSDGTPYIGSYKSPYSLRILDIFYGNASLVVADVHKLEDFANGNGSACHSPRNNSSSKLGLPFSISPANQNMVFYDCAQPPAPAVRRSRGLVDTACGDRTLVAVARRPDVPGSYYFLEGCNATVVPMLARPGDVDPANYREFVREGFLLTWQLPPPPPSPAGKLAIRI